MRTDKRLSLTHLGRIFTEFCLIHRWREIDRFKFWLFTQLRLVYSVMRWRKPFNFYLCLIYLFRLARKKIISNLKKKIQINPQKSFNNFVFLWAALKTVLCHFCWKSWNFLNFKDFQRFRKISTNFKWFKEFSILSKMLGNLRNNMIAKNFLKRISWDLKDFRIFLMIPRISRN